MAENETPETPEAEVVQADTSETETTAADVAADGRAEGEVSSAKRPDASRAAVAGAADAEARANRRKVREGLVISTGMDKTVVVAVTERVRHARYAKTVQRTRKLYVHDAENDANDGDRVRVAETRPLSKTKRWRLVEVLERAR